MSDTARRLLQLLHIDYSYIQEEMRPLFCSMCGVVGGMEATCLRVNVFSSEEIGMPQSKESITT